MEIVTNSLKETQEFAAKFAKDLKASDVIALSGELGAGKTSFVQGLAKGMGINKNYYVNSPTFAILNIYEGGKRSIYHFDWYRLTSENEVTDIGLDEYLDGKGISVVEWAEKFPNLLPARTIWIKLEMVSEDSRRIVIKE
jgi:tRNA threonylcarbamoyladenosine biosynthesis protein TsaE